MKNLKDAVMTAQKMVIETGNKYSVYKNGNGFDVAGYRSKENGMKIGTAFPITVYGNTVVHYKSR